MKTKRSRSTFFAAAAVALGCLAAGSFSTAASTAAVSTGGGIGLASLPKISDVICLTSCTKMREVSPGGSVQVTGTEMDSVKWVAFRSGNRNLRVEPDVITATRVEAEVPEGAISGRVRVVTSSGSVSDPSGQVLTIGDRIFARTGKLTVTDAQTTPNKAYQFGMRRPILNFVVNGSGAAVDLRVDIVNSDGDVVRSRFLNGVPTGSTQRVGLSGLANGGKPAPNGAYRFVVRGSDGSTASLSSRLRRERRQAVRVSKARAAAADPFGFHIYGFVFPLRAAHSYGDGIGAPRAGHTHQGQDVMAACGSPLVAARAGVVYYNEYDDAAGWYIVIDTRANGGRSMAYMHMPRQSPLKVGSRVKTGQPIGRVGDTGDASACHLHFELWSGPGWYQGGTFMNPTPSLKAWDRYS